MRRVAPVLSAAVAASVCTGFVSHSTCEEPSFSDIVKEFLKEINPFSSMEGSEESKKGDGEVFVSICVSMCELLSRIACLLIHVCNRVRGQAFPKE